LTLPKIKKAGITKGTTAAYLCGSQPTIGTQSSYICLPIIYNINNYTERV